MATVKTLPVTMANCSEPRKRASFQNAGAVSVRGDRAAFGVSFAATGDFTSRGAVDAMRGAPGVKGTASEQPGPSQVGLSLVYGPNVGGAGGLRVSSTIPNA